MGLLDDSFADAFGRTTAEASRRPSDRSGPRDAESGSRRPAATEAIELARQLRRRLEAAQRGRVVVQVRAYAGQRCDDRDAEAAQVARWADAGAQQHLRRPVRAGAEDHAVGPDPLPPAADDCTDRDGAVAG